MGLFIAKDTASLAEAVAKKVLEIAAGAVRENGRFSLVLSGGKTPEALFRTFGTPYIKARFPSNETTLFWADERAVPPHDKDSNFGTAKRLWLDPVGFPMSQALRMLGETKPPMEGARAYEKLLKSFFKIDLSLPKFDLVLLGLGDDGHTASLFPNSEAVKEKDKWVVSVRVPAVPADRISLTLPVLNNAAYVIFMVSGSNKAAALRDTLRKEIPAATLPASLVRPTSGRLDFFADVGAASKLLPDQKNAAQYL